MMIIIIMIMIIKIIVIIILCVYAYIYIYMYIWMAPPSGEGGGRDASTRGWVKPCVLKKRIYIYIYICIYIYIFICVFIYTHLYHVIGILEDAKNATTHMYDTRRLHNSCASMTDHRQRRHDKRCGAGEGASGVLGRRVSGSKYNKS